jgi:hypothetical protein
MITGIIEIKTYLYKEYGGFADKRYTNIANGNNYIVDKRANRSYGDPTSVDCLMFLYVIDDKKMRLSMSGNIPWTDSVKLFFKEKSACVSQAGSNIDIVLTPETYSMLDDLARIVESIVGPRKHYSVPSYKYVCPEIATALRRLTKVLAYIWLG